MAIAFKAGNPEASEFYVEPGEHTLRVVEAKEDTSKGGNDMIKLTLQVVRKDGSKGPKLFDYLVFTAAAFWKVDQFLKAAERHPGAGEEINIDADDLIGIEVEAELKIEEHEGKKSNKVESYLFDEF